MIKHRQNDNIVDSDIDDDDNSYNSSDNDEEDNGNDVVDRTNSRSGCNSSSSSCIVITIIIITTTIIITITKIIIHIVIMSIDMPAGVVKYVTSWKYAANCSVYLENLLGRMSAFCHDFVNQSSTTL